MGYRCWDRQRGPPVPGTGRERNVVYDAGDAIECLQRSGVRLVLSGHKHVPYVWRLEDLFVVNAGTVSSLRLRGNTRPCYNVIEIDGTRYSLLTLNAGGIQSALAVSQSVDLNPQNGTYTPLSGGSVVTLEAVPLNDTGQMLNIEFDSNGDRIRDLAAGIMPESPFWTNPAPFKILRQPMPTSAEPSQGG